MLIGKRDMINVRMFADMLVLYTVQADFSASETFPSTPDDATIERDVSDIIKLSKTRILTFRMVSNCFLKHF